MTSDGGRELVADKDVLISFRKLWREMWRNHSPERAQRLNAVVRVAVQAAYRDTPSNRHRSSSRPATGKPRRHAGA